MIAIIGEVLQGVLQGGLYALIAIGLSLSIGVVRPVNLAHGDFVATSIVTVGQQGFVGIGSYVFFEFAMLEHWSPIRALLMSPLIAGALAVPSLIVIFRLRSSYLAVGTWVVSEIAMLIAGRLPGFGLGAGASFAPSVIKAFGARTATRYETGLAIAAIARSEGVFDIGYVVAVGIGVGLTYVPTLTAAQLRAPGHAPLAAGIAGTGVGLGALFGAGLLGLLSNGLGWRVGLLVAGSTVVAAAVATIALASPKKKTVSHPPGVRDHYSVPAPWAAGGSAICLYAAYITIGMVAFVPFTGLIPLGREIGWRASTAIGMIGVVGAGSAVGRLVLSGVAERVGARRTSGMCGLIMGLTMALMAIASTPFAFAIPAFVFGACYGGMSALTGPSAAETFGRHQLGRSVGRMMTAWALGILTGPWLVAVASERLGEHRTTWMVCAALSVISGFLFLRAASPAIGEHQPSSS
jgi:predicted MFS family arabinose efflux permease